MILTAYFVGDGLLGEDGRYYVWTVKPNEDFSNDWDFEEVPESEYIENGGTLPDWREQELYEEALRATCSLCVLHGYCVCGELDPEDELEEDIDWEDEYPDDYDENDEDDFDFENQDWI